MAPLDGIRGGFAARGFAARGFAALALALAASPAGAVIGGREETGAASRSAVMVLTSRGGLCSAVVVAPDVVLTAAHCASGADQVRIHVPGGGAAPVLLEPAAIAVHPGYARDAVRERRRSIDLALVRLSNPLPGPFEAAALSAGAQPRKGAAIRLGGYGLAREGDPRSSGTFRSVGLAVAEPHGPGRILLWAVPAVGTASAGACEGDSGGPVAGPDEAVVAVTSWAAGAGGARCGEMSQAVLVAPQRAWIDRVLAGWRRAAGWR